MLFPRTFTSPLNVEYQEVSGKLLVRTEDSGKTVAVQDEMTSRYRRSPLALLGSVRTGGGTTGPYYSRLRAQPETSMKILTTGLQLYFTSTL